MPFLSYTLSNTRLHKVETSDTLWHIQATISPCPKQISGVALQITVSLHDVYSCTKGIKLISKKYTWHVKHAVIQPYHTPTNST